LQGCGREERLRDGMTPQRFQGRSGHRYSVCTRSPR
jgi:hypothetical protein